VIPFTSIVKRMRGPLRGTIGVMPETTHDLRERKNELVQKLQEAITKFETDTGLTVTEIVPHHLPTQDAWNQLRGLKLRIELLEKS
jgi:5-methylcytosine-specific restriction endonuclease McrA